MSSQPDHIASHRHATEKEFQEALTATLFASPVSLAIGAAAGSAGGLSAAYLATDPLTRCVGILIPAVGLLRVVHAAYVDRAVTSRGSHAYESGAWLFSFLLGALAYLTLTRTDHPGLHLLTACLAIGYAAGICARNAGRPRVALGQLALAALPISPALLVADDDPVKWVLAIVNVFFVVGLADITVKTHRIFLSAIAGARASEEEYRTAISHLPVMSWTARSDGQSSYQSPQWEAFTGTADIGSAFTNLGIVHHEDWAAVDAAWRRSVRSGSDFRARYRLLHRTGTYRWVLSVAQPERDDSGKIFRWHGACVDVDDTLPA